MIGLGRRHITAAAVGLAAALWAASATAALPSYSVSWISAGYPAAVNQQGDVVGFEIVGSAYRPWLSKGGGVPIGLPLPAGYPSAQPADINALGAVVGMASANIYASGVPVLWTPLAGGGYQVEVLAVLAGDVGGAASSINGLGEVVGTRSFRGNTGMVFSSACSWGADRAPVDLTPTGFTQFPVAINDARQVVGGSQRLDLGTGLVQELGVPTGGTVRYNWSRAAAMNERGDVAATLVTATSQGYGQAGRWRDGEGWRVLGGFGPYDGAVSINGLGDVGMIASYACPTTTARSAVVSFDGLGAACLSELLDAASRDWVIPSTSGPLIDDARRVVLVASNLATGAYGTVLLTPVEAVPPPAPSGLTATPIVATWQQPYHQIELRWTDNSAIELGFQVERRLQGAADFAPWQTLARDVTTWRDTQLALGATYEYRVKALGLAGDSGYSNVASATAPATPIDTTPPAITILAPAQGATVSGVVTVSFQASDAVGVTFMQIVAPVTSGEAVLCSTTTQSTLTCSWDTRALAPGAYGLQLYAGDAMNNGTAVTLTLTVAGSNQIRCSSLVLSGSATGTRASPRATATILDAAGRAVRSAWVAGTWTRPDGVTASAGAYTDSRGRATFSTSGPRGSWTFTVTGVTRSGYRFDAAGSVLTARRTY
jgi:hypothetical protein